MKDSFNRDVEATSGYLYTNENRLSARLSNSRISDAIHKHLDCRGKRILDIGCGDGTYTEEFITRGASFVLGIDPVENAISRANEKYSQHANMRFECVDAGALPAEERFDIVVLRGVLHHMDDMKEGIRIACALGREIAVMEPNGYNPVLKVIEKTSTYHIEHKEQSFFPSTLRKEFRKNGGTMLHGNYVGLVPFFCPDRFARLLKLVEPFVEALPLVKQISCGQYIMHVSTEKYVKI